MGEQEPGRRLQRSFSERYQPLIDKDAQPLTRDDFVTEIVVPMAVPQFPMTLTGQQARLAFQEHLDRQTSVFFQLGQDGSIRFVDDAFCAVFEYSREQLIGMHGSLLIVTPVPENRALYEAVRLGQRPSAGFDTDLRAHDGHIVPIHACVKLVVADGDVQIEATLLSALDRTRVAAMLKNGSNSPPQHGPSRLRLLEEQRMGQLVAAATEAATRAATSAALEILQHVLPFTTDPADGALVPVKRKGAPSFLDWWIYERFHEHLVRLETEALGSSDNISKQLISGMAGCDPKTITRAQKYHGLDPKMWPPSTWPASAPQSSS